MSLTILSVFVTPFLGSSGLLLLISSNSEIIFAVIYFVSPCLILSEIKASPRITFEYKREHILTTYT